jgi:alpha-tubulin suppressor-like RCC1 family protein
MPVVLQSNTITGLDTLVVSTSSTFTGNAYTPTRAVGDKSTVVANTSFVETNGTRPHITQLVSGGSNGIFFISDGKLYECHGSSGTSNYIGGRHTNNTDHVHGISRTSQVPIPDTSPVIKAWGGFHALALCANGNLYTWGYNGYGQLGLGDGTSRSSPVQIGAFTDWAYASAGNTHCMAIKTNRTLWAWGAGGEGKLGTLNSINRSSPVQVGSLTTWLKVSGSQRNTIAIKTT